MKITQTYYHQGKFLVLPEGEWPVKPAKIEGWGTKGGLKIEMGGDFGYEKSLRKYNEALTSALSKAVPFEDQGKIVHSAWESDERITNPITEGIYTIPPTEVEVVSLRRWRMSGIMNDWTDWLLEQPSWAGGVPFESKRVARIKDEKKDHARDYLISEGLDPDKLVEEGIKTINLNYAIARLKAIVDDSNLDFGIRNYCQVTLNQIESPSKPVEEETQEELTVSDLIDHWNQSIKDGNNHENSFDFILKNYTITRKK